MYSPTQPLPLCWFVTPTAQLVIVAGGFLFDVTPVDREIGLPVLPVLQICYT